MWSPSTWTSENCISGARRPGTPILPAALPPALALSTPLFFSHASVRLPSRSCACSRYVGLPKEHPESYWSFMHTNLFDHVDIKVRF